MSSPKFAYDAVVRVSQTANALLRPGARAWVVGVFAEPRPGAYFEKFPPGVVYSIEFEDGVSLEVHERDLEAEPPGGFEGHISDQPAD